MRQNFLFSIGVLTLLASCQDIGDEMMQEIPELRTSVESLTGIQHDIAVNILTRHFGGYTKGETSTRAAEEFSLSPYIVDGDTVMYIAQYKEGWEIYSGCYATDMVLFSSDEGTFSMADPQLPAQLHFLIEGTATEISELMDQNPEYVDPSWGHIAVSDEDIDRAEIQALTDGDERMTVSPGSTPPGHWVLIGTEHVEVTTAKSQKLIKTKWGQGKPWNAYAKWEVDSCDNVLKQCLAGCSAVAVAQYQYFTHAKDGIPSGGPTQARLNDEGRDYIFYLFSGNVWYEMAWSKSDWGTNNVALLIGNVGREINTNYGLKVSTANRYNVVNYLNKVYKNKNYSIKNFSYDDVKYWIDAGYPLISRAAHSNGLVPDTEEYGHMFIIDGYKEFSAVTRYTYGLVRDPLPAGSDNPWIDDLRDSNGNIIKYAYTKEIDVTDKDYKVITMNWGYDGAYDNTAYTPNDEWIIGANSYNINKFIITMD